MINIRKVTLQRNRRVIIISDIHANLSLLTRLLEKVHYSSDDYLFINGDLCEKGDNSLEVVRYVKKLVEEFPDVYVTKGNCDILYRYVFKGNEAIFNYMRKRKNSILNEMLAEHQKTVDDFSDAAELAQFYKENYRAEIDWFESLPIAFETESFILVHAGIENRLDWENTDENNALSIDSFYDKGHQAEKLVIVGHWPAVNYCFHAESSNNPIIDFEERVISIDGGNQIKTDGQLNALMYENNQFSYQFVDELRDVRTVRKDYIDQTNRVGTVTYPNYKINVIHRDRYFALCENINLGIEQWIKNEYLVENDEVVYCKDDLSTTFLSVKKGEVVKVLDDLQEGYILVKKGNGLVGWVPSEVL